MARASSSVRGIARAAELAIALDLDGTLIPLAATPSAATLDAGAHEILSHLAAAPGTRVAVVSGRPRSSLDMLFGARSDVWLAAEHGVWTRDDRQWSSLELRGTAPDVVEVALREVSRSYPRSIVERKTWSVCLHYRDVSFSEREGLIVEAMNTVHAWTTEHPEYEILEGALVLEVRHRGAHKGRAIEWLRQRLPAHASILALGDDATDEDAFDALGPHDVAIAVGRGDRPTRAQLRLASSPEVRSLLRWIARTRREHADAPDLGSMGVQPLWRKEGERNASLVVISNRLPPDEPAEDERTRNVGGLVSGISSALATRRGVWLGWSGHQHDGGDRNLAIDDRSCPARAAFDLSPDGYSLYYNGFANRALWPAFHGFVERARSRASEWSVYEHVNDLFAAHAVRVAAPRAAIWVHDYHLFLVARALRERGHGGPIGHFLHVPFPSLEAFETLPNARELIEGMLQFDLVGVHTRRYADNFIRAATQLANARWCEDQLQWAGRSVHVGVFPLGIDAGAFEVAPADDDAAAEVAGLRDALRGRSLVLGVDRLDYSKGILERLDAFARMLELHPEWRSRVSLLQVAVPSRKDVPEYREQRRAIETSIGRVNGEFGQADWVPVRYVYRSYGRASLTRLYRAASVGFVTPLRDGMNLVAKEYVAAQDAHDPGVLVLSRFAGAADELRDAVLINPYDSLGTAHALVQALTMPLEERVARHMKLWAAIQRNQPRDWANAFLRELSSMTLA